MLTWTVIRTGKTYQLMGPYGCGIATTLPERQKSDIDLRRRLTQSTKNGFFRKLDTVEKKKPRIIRSKPSKTNS